MRYGAACLLILSIVSAQTCEEVIQMHCLNDRFTPQSCGACAEAHANDLRKVCSSGRQIEQFCRSTKPVIGGFDVVEFFSLQPGAKGVLGRPDFAHNLTSQDKDGSPRFTYEFWFKNRENRDKFALDPWQYAPKNGGF